MDDTTPRPASSAAIAEDLRAVVALLVRRYRTNPAFPPHQVGVLRIIDRIGPQTTSQLAALEFVRPQSMAHTVQQLEAAGFITRRPDPNDGRQTLIGLSESGRRALSEQRRQVAGWLAAEIDRQLDPDERETLAHAVSLLGRIVTS